MGAKEVTIMHKTLVAIAATATLLLAPGFTTPARAAHSDWYVGGGFRIGPVHFSIVLGGPGQRHQGHYYYRSNHRVHYRGYQCTDRCFKQRGYYYHDPYCPVVLQHFDRHRANPYAAWERYAPRYRDGYPQYRDRGDYGRRWARPRHDGHDRYDRHDHRDHRGRACPYRH